ncbi:MAG: amidohydrolase family protein [Ferruginibacter sp.]
MSNFFFLLFVAIALSCGQLITGDILIEDVNIIDIEKGIIIYHQDVLINGNKISNIVDHGNTTIKSKTIVTGSGKFLMPGLWDMHLHTMRKEWYKNQFPLLRANGITGFREMWGDLTIAKFVRPQIQKDSLPYFRFVASGHVLDGKMPFWDGSIAVASTEAATVIVDSLIKDKSDFIKVYSFLEAEVFYAIARRCKENGIPFAGHVPHAVLLTDASKSGMASMEHLYGFLTEACTNSDSAMVLMRRSVKAFESGNKEERKRIGLLYNALVLNNFSPTKLKRIARLLKRNNTYIVPTLSMLRGEYFTNDTAFVNNPTKKYMSKETLDYWNEVTASDLKRNTALDWLNKRKRWLIEQQIMRILITEKVPIMAGTDADNPYAYPGFSLHDEMALFVQLGMSPGDALRSATIVPAKFLHINDSLGTVKKGKLADLLLLDQNPLENIENSRKINAVNANGKLYSKGYINSVLQK